MTFFTESKENELKINMKAKMTSNNQSNPKQREQFQNYQDI